jgi:hypothetical protein
VAADTDRRLALTSLRRLIGLAATHDAAIWVTHDPEDWAALRGTRRDQRKPAVTPPSIEMFCPVTHTDSSEAR